MGLADIFGKVVGSEPVDVNPVAYHGTGADYGAQQQTGQTSIAQGQGNQQVAAQSYQGVLNGTAPSLAQMQMQQGQQQAAEQGMQMAASARGTGGQMAAQGQAAQAQAMGAQQANAQGAMLRAQEVTAARGGLAGIGAAQQGLGQGYALGSQGQQVQEQGLDLQAQQGTQKEQTAANVAAQHENSGLLGSVVGGAAAAFGLSDENVKEEIVEVDPSHAMRAVADLPISTWKYKPGVVDGQRRVGPMAQDFAKALKEVGIESKSDKTIDLLSANGLLTAAFKGLESRVAKVEKGKGK